MRHLSLIHIFARVALYIGTWNKFHGSGEYKSYLQIAKEASKRLIDSKEYSLYADYRNLFLLPGEDSNEHILSFRYSAEADTYNPRDVYKRQGYIVIVIYFCRSK